MVWDFESSLVCSGRVSQGHIHSLVIWVNASEGEGQACRSIWKRLNNLNVLDFHLSPHTHTHTILNSAYRRKLNKSIQSTEDPHVQPVHQWLQALNVEIFSASWCIWSQCCVGSSGSEWDALSWEAARLACQTACMLTYFGSDSGFFMRREEADTLCAQMEMDA